MLWKIRNKFSFVALSLLGTHNYTTDCSENQSYDTASDKHLFIWLAEMPFCNWFKLSHATD